jgi:hypothetical protein
MTTSHLLLITAAAGCIGMAGLVSADPPQPAVSDKPAEGPFHKDLLKVAADYKTWGRVDDEMRWAPTLCRAPAPGRVYQSASMDNATHGQKLYSIFARKRDDYFQHLKGKTVAVGQVIVKQSWLPEEVTDPKERPAQRYDFHKVIRTPDPNPDPKRSQFAHEADHFYPYILKGDRVFKAAKQADLFIMMKLDPKTPATDQGWVYATVTPDGKNVTSAGKIESCMKCHQDAKGDRLFGLWK